MGSLNPLHCGAVVASFVLAAISAVLALVSIPFIAGQWSLPGPGGVRDQRAALVSIPFIAGQWSLPARTRPAWRRWSCFNPLHCGAVVASRARPRRERCRCRVSIPFIAGQWSLRGGPGPPRRQTLPVSIPFIAGQWSLRGRRPAERGDAQGFQSPSLRGSGRFRPSAAARRCARRAFQSPSLRGSGRFSPANTGDFGVFSRVSIPFIAGQWSLRPRGRGRNRRRGSFNPLHCGAVVASPRAQQIVAALPPDVSIPFIAGQWSLLFATISAVMALFVFQSPSLRGSGRFPPPGQWRRRGCGFQSPSLRGSGRFKNPL